MQLDWYFLNPNTAGVFYQYDPNGNLLWQQTVGGGSTGFLEHETATHYYWLPNEHGDILIGFDQGINSYAVYTDHLNTPRLVTKIENPQNPKALTDTSNDLPEGNYGEPQGISPLAIPVWQWSYSPFGADLANGYEAKPTTIANNFKPDLWTWTGLPETGGADPNQVAQETWRIQANLVVPPVLNLRYPGQYYDFEAGLVQNWWRTYEPRIGRYSSADPIGLNGGWNRFAYVAGDGINASDRMGLYTQIIRWAPGPGLSSSWGHISGDINGKNYSFGPGGWDKKYPMAVDYIKRQSSLDIDREGYGVELNLNHREEGDLEACILNFSQYTALNNPCGKPWIRCLEKIGAIHPGNRPQVLPEDVLKIIKSSKKAGAVKRYKGSRKLYNLPEY